MASDRDQRCALEVLEGEALRLQLAFYCIMEPERRAEVLALAEKHANPSHDPIAKWH
jgi:hypothetical protein